MPKRVDLSAYIAERRAAGAVEVVIDDDLTVTVDPIDLWPDDAKTDDELMAHLLGGAHNVARYNKAGGTSKLLFPMLLKAQEADGPMGESEASAAS